jgi:hypothetical protein
MPVIATVARRPFDLLANLFAMMGVRGRIRGHPGHPSLRR